jgi:purine-binding chemotaxis protein CheW
VLDIGLADRELTLGLVVDRVFDVRAFAATEVEPAPDIGVRWPSDYIEGVVRTEGGFVVLVDVARIFTAQDGAMLPSVAAAA